ncbi:MAG: hypothetical protein JO314_12435 [Acidobacteria bacterium]|nr:hypothetical protein [Acidobacteriota bacterium]
MADDRAIGSGGGLQKWTFASGTWTNVNTFTTNLTSGIHGVTMTTNGSGQPLFYCTTSDTLSKLVTVTDDGSASPAFTTLATAVTNEAFRSVAFAPGAAAPAHPQHVVDFDGDGKTDFSIIRDLSGGTDPNGAAQWWSLKSSTSNASASSQNWGFASDQFTPADLTATARRITRSGVGQRQTRWRPSGS